MGGDSYANFNSLPAVETTAHSHRAKAQTNKSGRDRSPCGNKTNTPAIAAATIQALSLFSTTFVPTPTTTPSATRNTRSSFVNAEQAAKSDMPYARTFAPRAPRVARGITCNERTSAPPRCMLSKQKQKPLGRSSVKTERQASDPSDEGSYGEDVVMVDGGYTSSSTTTEEGSIVTDDFTSTCDPSQHQQPAVFDKDDEAACDDLLMDILSGDGDGGVHDNGFLSLLTDDGTSAPAGGACGSNPSFVKQEMFC